MPSETIRAGKGERIVKRILITGMSGTGKSSVIDRLVACGYKAIDLDTDAWSEWGIVPGPGGSPGAPDWIWREDRVQRLLRTDEDKDLYLSGCAPNQGRFYDRFDRVVLLSAPVDVMLARVVSRTTNDFGKRADERAKIVEDTRVVEPLLRAGADVEIDTAAASLDDVVAAIVALGEDDQIPACRP